MIHSAEKHKQNLLAAEYNSVAASVNVRTHTNTNTQLKIQTGRSSWPLVVVLRGATVRPGGHLIPSLLLTFILSPPPPSSIPPTHPSIHYSGLSLPLSCLCTHSVTKSYFLFLSIFKCAHSSASNTV